MAEAQGLSGAESGKLKYIVGTSALPLPQTLLLSFPKYGTSLDRWYNWYIVYTTILGYNNHILFRVCQVYEK
jgi:hypothetical protein